MLFRRSNKVFQRCSNGKEKRWKVRKKVVTTVKKKEAYGSLKYFFAQLLISTKFSYRTNFAQHSFLLFWLCVPVVLLISLLIELARQSAQCHYHFMQFQRQHIPVAFKDMTQLLFLSQIHSWHFFIFFYKKIHIKDFTRLTRCNAFIKLFPRNLSLFTWSSFT